PAATSISTLSLPDALPISHQGSRPGCRRGVEVDGHSGLVARRHHLHWRILQECREAHLLQGRVSEGSGSSVQLESRRKRTPGDRDRKSTRLNSSHRTISYA